MQSASAEHARRKHARGMFAIVAPRHVSSQVLT
jgi:hypothetical protein